MEIKEENLYTPLLNKMMDLLRLKGYNEITVEELCDACNIDINNFNMFFSSKEDFCLKSMKCVYNKHGKSLENIQDFKELCKQFVILHLNSLDGLRGNLKTKKVDETYSNNSSDLYYLCFKEMQSFLTKEYQTRKIPSIEPDYEELFLYKLCSRILSFLVYFYNNKEVSKEKMIERIDTTLEA